MITITDIARKAGVAKSTVSRYLNGGSVSVKTRRKIDEIVKETGYTPNSFARSLKAKKTNMLGVIIPRLNSASSNEILSGIDQISYQKGYQLIITNANQNTERELDNLQTLANQKVEGIIFLAKEITDRHIELIQSLPIPVLVLGQKAEGIHCIVHDDYGAGQTIGKYALELGHRSLLFVGIPEEDQAVGKERKQGFLDAVHSCQNCIVRSVEADFSKQATYLKALEFLPGLKETYIACATDNIALAVLKAAKELKIPVPQILSISGFGGSEAASFVSPSITTMAYPFEQLGELSVREIEKLIQRKEVPHVTILKNELLIKESTKQSTTNR